MKFNVCYIEDGIPCTNEAVKDLVDERFRLNPNDLKNIIERVDEVEWNDSEERKLIDKLLNCQDLMLVVFTNPDFYFNYIENESFIPEVFILDWHFQGVNTEKILERILKQCFSFIFIYTRHDKEDEINGILESKFLGSMNRISLIHKEDEDSVNSLITKMNQCRETNFSLKFGKDLRRCSLETIEKILIELGNVTCHDIHNYFSATKDSKCDLIDFIGERFKSYLVNAMDEPIQADEQQSSNNASDQTIIEKLWSYRLYYYPNDNDKLVRKGDIIRKEDKYFLIISANCDLAKVWASNYGFFSCVPLYRFYEDRKKISEKFSLTKESLQSMKNQGLSQISMLAIIKEGLTMGHFFLPFVKISTNDNVVFQYFFVSPKEIQSLFVDPPNINPKKKIKEHPLNYDYIKDCNRICCLSEPFLTQVVEHIYNSLRGFGVPDYSDGAKDVIKVQSKRIFDT
jgi:hypothetical protein